METGAHLERRVRAPGEAKQLVLQHMVELLQNEHLVEAFHEPRRGLLRERVRRAHLPEAVGRQLDAALLQHAQRLARIGRRHPARHDSEARRACFT